MFRSNKVHRNCVLKA